MKTFKAPNWDSDAEGAYSHQELFKKSSNKKSHSKLISSNEKKQKKLKKIIKKQFSDLKSKDINFITVQTKIELGNAHKTRDDNSSATNFSALKEKKLRKKCKKSKAEVVSDSDDSDISVTKNQRKLLKRYSSELNNLNNNSDKLSKELLKERRRQKKLEKKLEKASNKQFVLDKGIITTVKDAENLKTKGIKKEKIDESDKLSLYLKNQRAKKLEQDKLGTLINIPKSLEIVKKIKLQEKLRAILNQVEKERKPILTLRQKMMEKLKAARFRFLNEQIYTTDSKEAQKIFERDPEAFIAYHEGYRQQVKSWPMNPLDIIIKAIKKMPETHIVADFGCGDAKLAKSVKQKVYSFDLVAINDMVVACDMSKVPLKDSSVDIAVFCLSLMGTNLHDYIIEANRVLKIGGTLKIAEVESRFDNLDIFIIGVQHFGFKKTWKDQSHNLFCFMDFKKVANIKSKKKLPTISLLPCLYKKR